MTDYLDTVQAGAALLDEKGPSNWRERINPDTLDTDSLTQCVLGQVFGTYMEGMNALFGKNSWTFGKINEEYGFERIYDDPEGDLDHWQEHADLTSTWLRLLDSEKVDA